MKEDMKEDLKFEDALKRLEHIVSNLENGIDELDKVVSLFEEGSELVRYCNKKLEKVENKIEVLSRKLNNSEIEEERNNE